MNDLPVGRSVDETLRLVQAFQYTDTHGEVCPAGWKPGADTVGTHFWQPLTDKALSLMDPMLQSQFYVFCQHWSHGVFNKYVYIKYHLFQLVGLVENLKVIVLLNYNLPLE